ncbi:MAG: T9SS type A sorting domain-containing protein [Bacteroidetes bacterium]|nr:T9SS type A sorting domain-containing protein [Fibrella sp.]
MKQLYKGCLLITCYLGLSSLSWGQCFNPAITPQVDVNAYGVAVSDFNGDGKPDVAAANTNNSTILVLLGSGNGNFSSFTRYNAGKSPAAVAAGDFNSDGKPDLVAANQIDNTISILLNTGTNGFSNPSSFGVGAAPRAVVVADFNADGRLDVATANFGNNTTSVLLGNGNGTFSSAVTFGTAGGPYQFEYSSIAVGDFNRDGRADLVMTNSSASLVTLLLGRGNGTFDVSRFGVGNKPLAVTVADFNLDNNPDLAIATAGNTNSNIALLLGNGNGSFGSLTSFSGGNGSILSIVASDFNGDSKPDLATVNNSANTSTASVVLGNGTGGFGGPTSFNVGIFPGAIAAGDFNVDGKPDLVTANFSDNAVSILLNCTTLSPPPPTPPATTGLTLATPTYDCTTGQLTLSTTGGNSTPIEYRIAGLRDWSINNSFSVPGHQQNGTTFTLEARQSGQVVGLPFTTACQTTTPTPPALPTPPAPPIPPTGSGLSLATPAYDCNTGQLAVITTGGNGQFVEYRIAGLRDWAAGNTFTVPTYQRTGTNFTLEARQSGQVVSLAFTSACQTTTPTPPPTPPVTPPTPPAGTPLTVNAQSLDCQTGVLQLVTAGGDGAAIEFKVPGLRDFAASASFTVPTYQRSGTSFTLFARQSGPEVTATYTATCPVGVRLASPETVRSLAVVVYPNPVGAEFTVGVSGAAGESVRFELTNLTGQTVVEQRAEVVSDQHTETLRMPAPGSGMYLLRVSTNGQSQTVKVLKP